MENRKNSLDDIAKTGLKIIGFGNKFRCDDGIGPAVIEELEKLEIPKRNKVEIIDGGTSGSDLIFHIRECPRIIIIDALDAGQEKGEIACIRERDIESFPARKISSFSLHDLDLSDILEMARAMKLEADITIIGINPINTGFGEGLSGPVSRKVPQVISMIKKMMP